MDPRLERARQCWARGQYDDMVALLTSLLASSDDPAEFEAVLTWRGAAYYRLGRVDRAIDDLDNAIQGGAHVSALYLSNRALANVALGRLAEALLDANRAVDLDAESWPSLVGRARVYWSVWQFVACAADLGRAIALLQLPPPADRRTNLINALILRRGRALMRAEQYGQAVEVLASIGPGAKSSHSGQAVLVRALAHCKGGQWTAAIDAYTELIRIDPANARAYKGRGRAHWLAGHLELALDDVRQAQDLDPASSVTALNQSGLLVELGDYERAIATCTQIVNSVVQTDDSRTDAMSLRALAYSLTGQYAAGLADCTSCLAMSPDHPGALLVRASLRLKQSRPSIAAHDLQRLLQVKQQQQNVAYIEEMLASCRALIKNEERRSNMLKYLENGAGPVANASFDPDNNMQIRSVLDPSTTIADRWRPAPLQNRPNLKIQV